MILLSTLIARATAAFAGHGLIVGLVAAFGIMVLTWDRGRINSAVERGKESARVEQKAATDAANNRGSAAADKSMRVQPSRGTPLTYRD
jgi:hypothetical protein